MFRREVRYPKLEQILLFIAAMDVMLTHLILGLGGVEANPLALRVVDGGGTLGMSLYKFALVAVVVCIVEFIGARRDATGRLLAKAAIGINMFPIVVALMILPSLFVTYWTA